MDSELEFDLTYSQWHRTFGWLYPAMDLDNIEIRNGLPVALIETTMADGSGINGAFDRFLGGVFQPETIWWAATQLGIPAYVAAVRSSSSHDVLEIGLLSFDTGQAELYTPDSYRNFLENISVPENRNPLSFPDLFEELGTKFLAVRKHPYFMAKHKKRWLREYQEYMDDLSSLKLVRQKPAIATQGAVKPEITRVRPAVYTKYRQKLDLDWLRIDWIEWRDISNSIGRPAAIIKTVPVVEPLEENAVKKYQEFMGSQVSRWWVTIATRLKVRWYFVAYDLPLTRLYVWRNDGEHRVFTDSQYVNWIRNL